MPRRVSRNTDQIELMIKQGKSNARILMNTSLIVVAFTAFALIVTLQSRILIEHQVLTMQLVLAIPLLLTSTLANSKLTYTKHAPKWETLGWSAFIFGYGFLINVVGILIFILVGVPFAMLFFAVNILLTFGYSAVEVSYNRKALARRLAKDLTFVLILFIFGMVPIASL